MNSEKRKRWETEKVVLTTHEINLRQFHIRLDQLAEVLYAELRQLSFIDPKSSSNSISVIHDLPENHSTAQAVSPDEEELYGAA